MRIFSSAALLYFLAVGCGCAADRVTGKDGNIVVQDSSGKETTLTQTGLDSDPWISPDGRTIVFLRHSAADTFKTSVFEMDMQTRTPRLLYGGPAKYQGREDSYFGRPELDESHDTLFLLSKEYATEGALIAIRLRDAQVKLVSDHVVGYDVVECGMDRGDLIALKRNQDILGRPYFLYWLYARDGAELGLAGGQELDLGRLRDGGCEGTQPIPPVPASYANPLEGEVLRVDGSAMEKRLVTHIEPAYPSQAQVEHIQGDVRLQIRVAADGTVQDASLVSGPPQLVAAAVTAVRQWRFKPVMSSGHPVPVVSVVSVPFRLPGK
jgi:TonB family protein